MTPHDHEEVLILQVLHAFDVAMEAPGGAPILWILAQAQEDCKDAMLALININPTKTEEIRALQNEIARNQDLTRWMRDAVVRGQALFQDKNADERHFVGEFAQESESGEQVQED